MPVKLTTKTPKKDRHRLTPEQEDQIIEGLYDGHSLLSICQKHGISRLAVQMTERNDTAFSDSLSQARQALAEMQVEEITDHLMSIFRGTQTPEEALKVIDKLGQNVRWAAERTSERYNRKKPQEAAKQKAKKLALNVPPRERIK